MEINMTVNGTTCIITPSGQVDALTSPKLNEYFQEKLIEYHNLVGDLSKVDFISSAGLRVLLATVKDARRSGGDLRLAGVKDDVKKVLSVSGFDQILKIYPDVQSAITSYSE